MVAEEIVKVELRAEQLMDETDPRSARELLPDFERVLGPDPCGRDKAALSIEERQRLAHQRWTATGGQCRAYMIEVAANLGVAITIDEFWPSKTGNLRCGHRLRANGIQFYWRVNVPGLVTVTKFRPGRSRRATSSAASSCRTSNASCGGSRRLTPTSFFPTAEPDMDRINGAGTIDLGGGKRGFREENLGTGTEGTDVTADFMNAFQEELMKVIEACGFVPSAAAWDQLAKAIQSQKLNWPVVGGSANAIALTLPIIPANLAALVGVPIRFLATAANTGAVTVAVNALPATPARRRGSGALLANHWLAGDIVEIVYDGTVFQVVSVTAPSADDVVKDALYPYMSARRGLDFTSAASIETGFSNWGVPTGDASIIAGFNTANSLFTVPAGMGGLWYAHGYANSLTSGDQPTLGHGMRLKYNGVIIDASSSPANLFVHCKTSAILPLSAGDTVQLFNFPNNSGVDLSDFFFTLIRFGRVN